MNLVIQGVPARSVICEDDVSSLSDSSLAGVGKTIDRLQIARIVVSIRNRSLTIKAFGPSDSVGEPLNLRRRFCRRFW